MNMFINIDANLRFPDIWVVKMETSTRRIRFGGQKEQVPGPRGETTDPKSSDKLRKLKLTP